MCIGLRGWRNILRNGGTQIAKTGRRNDPETLAHKSSCIGEALVEPAASAMDRKQSNAVASFGVFDRARAGIGNQAASGGCVEGPA